jgi:membrane associated rhomboid family serine protease
MKSPGAALLLAVIFAAYAVELVHGAPGHAAALYALGALPDDAGLQREWWRLLAFGFLHWNSAHLLANTALLAWLAPVLERRVGAWRLWALFLCSSVVGGFAILCKHAWWPAPGVTVGASGGAFAVLAASAWLLWRDPASPRRARIALAAVAGIGAAVSLLPGVSVLGHAVGAGIGLAFAWLQSPRTISPVSTLRSTP